VSMPKAYAQENGLPKPITNSFLDTNNFLESMNKTIKKKCKADKCMDSLFQTYMHRILPHYA